MRPRAAASLAHSLHLMGALAFLGCGSPSCGGDGTTKEKRAFLTDLPEAGMRVLDNGAATHASPANDAPLVFGLHGRGDTPESFSDMFHAYGTRARFYFPRAPTPSGEGYTWFSLGPGMTDNDVAKSLDEARDALHTRIRAIAGPRKYAVVGFSQGGFLAYAFAAKYPDELACAIPIAGALPEPLRPPHPRSGATLPVVRAFHGDADSRVDVAWDRDTIASFVAAGGDAKLVVFPGLAHRTTPEVRSDVYAALDACLTTSDASRR